ncbi:hypothetical protein BV25DRAFT_1991962 [Artomyces pyxidatus]|uniref:Uncharacterized protein n=1 Tax=Artomyces pyxidatus TaxID=48021 RepID=A0ACB8SYN9_9AGAM|nr:hypothetical protein BV25DRAFT_1991962 [Artomyces pyxidatus]
MALTPAAIAKEKACTGNAAFKAADYPSAVGHYTAAVLADANDPTYPLNRAAAYLKLGKNEDAERDCTRVLTLSSNNVKAMFRRAQARIGLQKYAEARKDLQAALKLEPANSAVKSELAKVDGLIGKGKAKAKSAPIDIALPTPVKRRRIPITIVEPAEASPSTVSPAGKPDDLLNPVSSRPLDATRTTTSNPPPANPAPKPASFKEAKQARETTKPVSRPGGGIFRASGDHTIFKSSTSDAKQTPDRTSKTQDAKVTEQTQPSSPNPVQEAPSGTTPSTVLEAPATLDATAYPAPSLGDATQKPPMTLFAFTREWNALSAPVDRWACLTRIPPSTLPALFRTSLDAAFLASLLTTFRALLDVALPREWIADYMRELRRTARFAVVCLMLSPFESEMGQTVWKSVGGEGQWGP